MAKRSQGQSEGEQCCTVFGRRSRRSVNWQFTPLAVIMWTILLSVSFSFLFSIFLKSLRGSRALPGAMPALPLAAVPASKKADISGSAYSFLHILATGAGEGRGGHGVWRGGSGRGGAWWEWVRGGSGWCRRATRLLKVILSLLRRSLVVRHDTSLGHDSGGVQVGVGGVWGADLGGGCIKASWLS